MKRTQTKVLSILLSLAMLCGLAVPTAFAADSRYTDTTDHWAETAIERWSDYGIIEGYGDAFNPDNSITRGQMATILSKTLGLTEEAENPFSDISADDWYAPYVLRCYKAGIMLGDNGRANPNAEITRQEAMTMFCRAFGIKADETADLTTFKDSGAVADWALPYVSALINSGIVSGVSSDTIAPADSMSRAALVTILDRAVVQYINTSGEYDLTDSNGIILVTAGDTTLKGETKADILITQATDGKSVTFKDATVTGVVTVQADTKIITDNAKLPEIEATIEDITVVEDKKSSTTRRPSGGSSGGNSRPSTSNLTISEEKAVTSGTYQNVTITDAVADGEVTLSNVTIKGDLTIKGGGSSSIKLDACTVQGKVIMAKETGEAPRLELTNTPITTVEVQRPAIIEAVDNASAVTKIEATADIEIKGKNTKVDTLAIPETAESAVAVTVTAGSVATVEAKAETTVLGASNSVNTIIATAAVTADSNAVQKVEIPETATESVSVTVTGDSAVDVEINSANGAAVTGENITVSTTLETAPDNITIGGESLTHIHKWGEPEIFKATCEQNGVKLYTCIADGCGENAMTKKESIPALGHDFSKEWTTCEVSHWHKCTRENCDAISDDEDHKWDDGKITTEPTCDNEGVKTYTCPVCNKTKTEPIPENGHAWDDWVKVDEINHKRTCKTDGTHTETADHTPIIDDEIEATCTETGKTEGSHCDICNSVIVEQTTTPALKHDFTGEYEKDADGHWHICLRDDCEETDTKGGHNYNTTNCAEVATCTTCNYEKPAGEHTWGDWEKVDEENHKHTCSSCNEPETAEHKWDDGEITTEPTEEKEGVKTFTCPECNATKTESVPVISAVKITLVQNGTNIEATWEGANCDNGYTWALIENGDIHQLNWVRNNVFSSGDFKPDLTRIESGVYSYDFVLYEYDESAEDCIGKELGRLDNAIEVTIAGESVGYTMSFIAPTDGQYQITLDSVPNVGDTYLTRWNRGRSNYSSIYVSDGTQTYTETTFMGALQDGDIYDLRLLTTYILEEQTIKAVMTPPSIATYEETTISFRKWNTDIMFDGYDDVADTKSLEVDGIKVLSKKTETMSEFLFDYDQTKGNITDADFVVELDGVEKERIKGNVDVTLSNIDVTFTINADGTLSFDATTHGSFAYETTTKDGMTHQAGRIAFKNGTLMDGWMLPTLADGETIDIMHIDCTYDETTKAISATISKHTIKTYEEPTTMSN